MKEVRISVFQLLSLMTLFLLGSTLIVGLNLQANEDSAFPAMISMVIGAATFYCYLFLLFRGSWQHFVPLLCRSFGSWIGKTIAICYAAYFIYIAGRVLKDFAFFINQMLFEDSPLWVISVPFLFVIGYTLMLGFETIARSAEVLVFIVIGIYVVLWLVGFYSPEFEWKYLFPLFQTDLKTLMDTIYPQGITFPYGELVVFLVVLPEVSNRQRIRRYVWLPILLTGFISILCIEMIIGILHMPFAKEFIHPFITSLQMIMYLDVIEHLEIYTSLIQLAGGFIKISVFIYAAHSILNQIFPLRQIGWSIPVLCGVVFICSMLYASNLSEHLYVGLKIVPYVLHLPLQFGIPIILGMIVVWKSKWKKIGART